MWREKHTTPLGCQILSPTKHRVFEIFNAYDLACHINGEVSSIPLTPAMPALEVGNTTLLPESCKDNSYAYVDPSVSLRIRPATQN